MSDRGLVKRSFSLAGHRTSVALEPPFWAALAREAAANSQPLARLVAEIDKSRLPDQGLASALRVFALERASDSNKTRSMQQAMGSF